MIEKRDIYIPCFQDMRMLHIYLPEDYEKETRHYPVLYMFDGHNLFYDEDATFGRSWGLKRWLDEHTMPLIVVGVECNHEGNRRLEEFSPYDFSDATVGFIHGQGKELMEWMSSDLKRWIDHAYRTLPGKHHTAIGGSSMGGLMALYAVVHHCDIYSKAAVLSPFIYRLKDELLTEIRACPKLRSHKIYISWGSDEFRTKQQLALASGRILELTKTSIIKRSTASRIRKSLRYRFQYACISFPYAISFCSRSLTAFVITIFLRPDIAVPSFPYLYHTIGYADVHTSGIIR